MASLSPSRSNESIELTLKKMKKKKKKIESSVSQECGEPPDEMSQVHEAFLRSRESINLRRIFQA